MSRLILTIPLLFFLLFGFAGCKKELKREEPAENETAVTAGTRASYSYIKPDDKYEFPDMSHLKGIAVPLRFNALQMPNDVLTNISTAGLLETCLDFPYLLLMFTYNDYQMGFELGLLATFNGFRELMERPDLADALIRKSYDLRFNVANNMILKYEEEKRFSFRYFVLEFIIAQDVVIENLSEEQVRTLLLLAFENSKIKKSNPDIFGGWHYVSRALLFAKIVRNDNQIRADMRGTLDNFIRAPRPVGQGVSNYLEDYIKDKFNIVEL